MSDLFSNLNRVLDEMLSDLNESMAKREAAMEESLKDEPELLLRYKSAMFHLDEWIKSHPDQRPPDDDYFLKFLK